MLENIISIVVYFLVGITFCILGYYMFGYTRKLNLNEEIDNHNKAAGIAIGGMFIAIAIIMSGVVY